MTQIYESMFVLDNQVVREGWKDAKAVVTGTLEKHGGTVLAARRWDERRLAYPINGRNRGTFLLAYYTLPAEAAPAMRRDFDLSEKVLRYLQLAVDVVPDEEAELAASEQSDDFSVPEPPDDDAIDEVEEEGSTEGAKPADAKAADAKPADAKAADAKPEDAKPADAKPADAKTADAKTEDAKPEESKADEAKPEGEAPAETASAEAAPAAEAPAAEAAPEAAAEAPAEPAAEAAPETETTPKEEA